MSDTGHWQLPQNVPSLPEGVYGFIYLITNLVCRKSYIGKKQVLTLRKRKPLKGKKNKRIDTIETDWKTYTSSSEQVNRDIELHGKENFKFEILRFCYSKSELAYFEAKEQFDREVLLREDYYNGIINLRIGKIKGFKKS